MSSPRRSRIRWTLRAATCLALASSASALEPSLRSGSWRAWLDSPGGELPFLLELRRTDSAWRARIGNGHERIDVPHTSWTDGAILLDIDHYDAEIRASLDASGTKLDGAWTKTGRGGKRSRLPFHATFGSAPRFAPITDPPARPNKLPRRWSVRFDSSSDPAVGVFDQEQDGVVLATFLTTTGDYRFLEGRLDSDRLRLSAFDGAHAFLFDARLQADGTLIGDFWSRDAWHETWTAKPDPDAQLPDAFDQTGWSEGVRLEDLAYPDLDGRIRSLADPLFAGRVRIIEVFGSWCPNCHDASAYLTDLHRRYKSRGLSVLGLAFELTGDHKRDARQVRRFVSRHNIEYPILLAGTSDKAQAGKSLPLLDSIRSYPTTLFLDASNRVRAVHTGFSGPATGDAFKEQCAKFESIIERLLAEEATPRK